MNDYVPEELCFRSVCRIDAPGECGGSLDDIGEYDVGGVADGCSVMVYTLEEA